MLAAMGLADFFRRHRNVFSISSKEVDAEPGDEDMLVEEYGERAVEASHLAPRPGQVGQRTWAGAAAQLDVSADELADEDPPPTSAS
jgi:hypothetical protein